MRVLVITSASHVRGEAQSIMKLIDSDVVERVHLRKPDMTVEQTRRYIESVPAEYYPFLSIHDHLHLAVEYGLGGIHLNRRNPEPPTGRFPGLTSRSCHSAGEVKEAILSRHADYCFLSPVFDSVSKPGRHGEIDRTECRELSSTGILDERVYALSGITPENLPEVKDMGFKGAAILGAAWQSPSIEEFINRLKKYR